VASNFRPSDPLVEQPNDTMLEHFPVAAMEFALSSYYCSVYHQPEWKEI